MKYFRIVIFAILILISPLLLSAEENRLVVSGSQISLEEDYSEYLAGDISKERLSLLASRITDEYSRRGYTLNVVEAVSYKNGLVTVIVKEPLIVDLKINKNDRVNQYFSLLLDKPYNRIDVSALAEKIKDQYNYKKIIITPERVDDLSIILNIDCISNPGNDFRFEIGYDNIYGLEPLVCFRKKINNFSTDIRLKSGWLKDWKLLSYEGLFLYKLIYLKTNASWSNEPVVESYSEFNHAQISASAGLFLQNSNYIFQIGLGNRYGFLDNYNKLKKYYDIYVPVKFVLSNKGYLLDSKKGYYCDNNIFFGLSSFVSNVYVHGNSNYAFTIQPLVYFFLTFGAGAIYSYPINRLIYQNDSSTSIIATGKPVAELANLFIINEFEFIPNFISGLAGFSSGIKYNSKLEYLCVGSLGLKSVYKNYHFKFMYIHDFYDIASFGNVSFEFINTF